MLEQSLLLKQLNVLIKMHIIKRRWISLDIRKNHVECPSVIGPCLRHFFLEISKQREMRSSAHEKIVKNIRSSGRDLFLIMKLYLIT